MESWLGGGSSRMFVLLLLVLGCQLVTGVWEERQYGIKPFERDDFMATGCGEDLWLFGGKGDQVVDDFWRYQADSGWTEINSIPLPSAREDSILVCERSRFLLLFGGTTGTANFNQLWRLDTENVNNGWTLLPSSGNAPVPTKDMGGCTIGQRLYIFGGLNDAGEVLDDMYYYDIGAPITGWVKIVKGVVWPSAREDHSLTCHEDYNSIILYGGVESSGLPALASMYVFDIQTETWQQKADNNPPIREDHVAAVWGDVLFVFGGAGERAILNDFWFYNENAGWFEIPRSDEWPVARKDMGAGLATKTMPDGEKRKIFVLFGGVAVRKFSDTWTFDEYRCPDDCNNVGECIHGKCICPSNLSGVSCADSKNDNGNTDLTVTLSIILSFASMLSLLGISLAVIYWRKGVAHTKKMRKMMEERREEILLDIYPAGIAKQVTQMGPNFAQRFEDVSIMFTDIVGFTHMSGIIEPEEVVKMLDTIFSTMDSVILSTRLEKIKTIGDAYMVCGGIPQQYQGHLVEILDAGLKIIEKCTSITVNGEAISLRVGVNVGAVVAGCIGGKRVHYDCWGNTVNATTGEVLLYIPATCKGQPVVLIRRLPEETKKGQFVILYPPNVDLTNAQLYADCAELPKDLALGQIQSVHKLHPVLADGNFVRGQVTLKHDLGGMLSEDPIKCPYSWQHMDRTQSAVAVEKTMLSSFLDQE